MCPNAGDIFSGPYRSYHCTVDTMVVFVSLAFKLRDLISVLHLKIYIINELLCAVAYE
jgi:hypothetical protein